MSPSLTREEADALIAKGSRQSGDAVRTCARRQGRGGGATPKERDIQKAILAFLATVPGVVAWRTNSGAAMLPGHGGKGQHVRFGFKGLSDIVGWVSERWGHGDPNWISGGRWNGARWIQYGHPNGRFLAIEVKTAKTYPTAEQQAFLDYVKTAGGIAICARSVHDVALALDVAAPASGAGARPRGDGR